MNVQRGIELKSSAGRISLRPPGVEDVPAIYAAATVSLQELMPWMDWCHPEYSSDETKDWIVSLPLSWKDGESYQFSIFDVQTGQVLGGCGLNHINRFYLLANLG